MKSSDADTVEIPIELAAVPLPEQPIPVQVDAFGLSHPGKVRPNNEDHFLVIRFGRFLERLHTNLPEGEIPSMAGEVGYGMAVADGIGGNAGGEVASKLAISALVQSVLDLPDWILRLKDDSYVQEAMRRARDRFAQVRAAMTEQARNDPSLQRFGTTMTVAYSLAWDLLLTHIGDSRAYLLRQDSIWQLTRDHTLAQAMADARIIGQEEVAAHRLRHTLTRSLGTAGEPVAPDLHRVALESGDRLLLCSDGLSEMVPNANIARILGTEKTAADACHQLVNAALTAGGKDNITVVVATYRAAG
jgi:protein phosphatase